MAIRCGLPRLYATQAACHFTTHLPKELIHFSKIPVSTPSGIKISFEKLGDHVVLHVERPSLETRTSIAFQLQQIISITATFPPHPEDTGLKSKTMEMRTPTHDAAMARFLADLIPKLKAN